MCGVSAAASSNHGAHLLSVRWLVKRAVGDFDGSTLQRRHQSWSHMRAPSVSDNTRDLISRLWAWRVVSAVIAPRGPRPNQRPCSC